MFLTIVFALIFVFWILPVLVPLAILSVVYAFVFFKETLKVLLGKA